MTSKLAKPILLICLLLGLFGCEDATPSVSADFQVTIQNLSVAETATVLSAGVYLINREGFPLYFSNAQDFGEGLEELAEDGFVTRLVENLKIKETVLQVDSFEAILPGQEINFQFNASYGEFFNFATMFTDSNDLFYSFNEDGIPLFSPDGSPVEGDFTSLIWLWDVGTEQNEEPYLGEFQPGRQVNPGDGVIENGRIRLVNDGFSYPPKFTIIRVLISAL